MPHTMNIEMKAQPISDFDKDYIHTILPYIDFSSNDFVDEEYPIFALYVGNNLLINNTDEAALKQMILEKYENQSSNNSLSALERTIAMIKALWACNFDFGSPEFNNNPLDREKEYAFMLNLCDKLMRLPSISKRKYNVVQSFAVDLMEHYNNDTNDTIENAAIVFEPNTYSEAIAQCTDLSTISLNSYLTKLTFADTVNFPSIDENEIVSIHCNPTGRLTSNDLKDILNRNISDDDLVEYNGVIYDLAAKIH